MGVSTNDGQARTGDAGGRTHHQQEKTMIRKIVLSTAALSVGAAMAFAAAPLAQAAPTGQTCSTTAYSTLCQSPGNAQLSATPPTVAYPWQGYYGGYGNPFLYGGPGW
jgi:hypothetical protein